MRAGRPLPEIIGEAVRIHAPLTHVPYHERIDQGFVNFVNNDHCLLSARATTHLASLLPQRLAGLPMAQTVWYIPTGLDIWNQKINKAPGHYARSGKPLDGPPVKPVVHWPDQEPERIEGSVDEKLDHWLDLVHRGHVLEAYRVFLGIMEEPAHRKEALAQLVFAGLIDLQDRVYLNRSYTTGHKSFRARATVELGNFVGWDNAHHVIYAGALDIGVGPRWYSTYEMACNCITHFIEKQKISAIPYGGSTTKEAEILRNTVPLSKDEATAFLDIVLHRYEPDHQEALSRLLLAGKGPRQILDVLQIGAAQVLLETQDTLNFSIPQHCYEYLNTLGWFYDNFEHPQRLKLLYVAASYLNRNAWHARQTGDGREAQPWRAVGRRHAGSCATRGAHRHRDCRTRWAAGAGVDARLSRKWRRQDAAHRAAGAGCHAASAMTRTIRSWARSCSKTTPRTAASTGIACCSRACSTPPCIASTATSWKRVGAMALPWVWPSCSEPRPKHWPRRLSRRPAATRGAVTFARMKRGATRMTLTLADANRVIAGAIAKAAEIGAKMNIAVCDAGGRLVAFQRMDGATWAGAYGSQGKAVASAAFGRPSGELTPRADHPTLRGIVMAEGNHMFLGQGAVPIFRGGVLIGACGVGGGTAQEDEDCARAGAESLR